jgi:hypothetical protein
MAIKADQYPPYCTQALLKTPIHFIRRAIWSIRRPQSGAQSDLQVCEYERHRTRTPSCRARRNWPAAPFGLGLARHWHSSIAGRLRRALAATTTTASPTAPGASAGTTATS